MFSPFSLLSISVFFSIFSQFSLLSLLSIFSVFSLCSLFSLLSLFSIAAQHHRTRHGAAQGACDRHVMAYLGISPFSVVWVQCECTAVPVRQYYEIRRAKTLAEICGARHGDVTVQHELDKDVPQIKAPPHMRSLKGAPCGQVHRGADRPGHRSEPGSFCNGLRRGGGRTLMAMPQRHGRDSHDQQWRWAICTVPSHHAARCQPDQGHAKTWAAVQ